MFEALKGQWLEEGSMIRSGVQQKTGHTQMGLLRTGEKGTLYNGVCKVKGNPQGTYSTRCECEVGKNEKLPLAWVPQWKQEY